MLTVYRVPFALKTYLNGADVDPEANKKSFFGSIKTFFSGESQEDEVDTTLPPKMDAFRDLFCRKGVEVEFLGLFDTVSSVGYFDLPFTKAKKLPTREPEARHIRHAVALDERRVKFKPALFDEEYAFEHPTGKDHNGKYIIETPSGQKDTDIVEMWFAGNHGDIGGGWHIDRKIDPVTKKKVKFSEYQLSDIALHWMITEILKIQEERVEEGKSLDGEIGFNQDMFKWKDDMEADDGKHIQEAIKSRVHDLLKFRGSDMGKFQFFTTIGWWIMGMVSFP